MTSLVIRSEIWGNIFLCDLLILWGLGSFFSTNQNRERKSDEFFHICRTMDNKSEKTEKPEIRWEDLPKVTREFTCFLNLVMDETIESGTDQFAPTYIRCFGKKCHGIIETSIDYELNQINWRCTSCNKSGTISKIFGE